MVNVGFDGAGGTKEGEMNRFIAVIIVAFMLGGVLGWIFCLWLYSVQMEAAIKRAEADVAKRVGVTMKHNQACVAKWKTTPQCVEWY